MQSKKPYGTSLVVPVVKGLIQLWSFISPYDWARRLFWKNHEDIPFWFAEVYLMAWLVVLLIGLSSSAKDAVSSPWLIVAVFRLVDILVGSGRVIFIEREDREDDLGHYILARNLNRWIILVLVNFGEIIVAFAILYLRVGGQFSKDGIADGITAIYQSILTLTTLGYGELHPLTNAARLHVIAQLLYFLIFVLLVAPVVFSAVRAREKPPS